MNAEKESAATEPVSPQVTGMKRKNGHQVHPG